MSPSAKCSCFPLSEVSLVSLVKALGYYYSHVLCVLSFLIRNDFGTKHWQLFSLVGEILNGKEELASKEFYCSKGQHSKSLMAIYHPSRVKVGFGLISYATSKQKSQKQMGITQDNCITLLTKGGGNHC